MPHGGEMIAVAQNDLIENAVRTGDAAESRGGQIHLTWRKRRQHRAGGEATL
jgi:hypothetical protein